MEEKSLEQQLAEQVKDLKSRILDTQDALVQARQSEQELAQALTEIVRIVGLQSDTGNVQLVAVVEAVKQLVDAQEFTEEFTEESE